MIWMPNHTKLSVVCRATAFLLICRTPYKLPGANIKINTNNLQYEWLKIFTKSFQEEGIYAKYIFVLNIINELAISGDFVNTYITNLTNLK
jgi:hypothetical protein